MLLIYLSWIEEIATQNGFTTQLLSCQNARYVAELNLISLSMKTWIMNVLLLEEL